MDDLNNGIRRIAEELRALQEQLQQAGLLADSDRHAHRWEIGRRMGSLIARLQAYFYVHQHAPATIRHRHAPLQAPRPD